MGNTIYAAFADPSQAEKATGALLDHGVRPEDISVVGYMTEPEAGKHIITKSGNKHELTAQGWNHLK